MINGLFNSVMVCLRTIGKVSQALPQPCYPLVACPTPCVVNLEALYHVSHNSDLVITTLISLALQPTKTSHTRRTRSRDGKVDTVSADYASKADDTLVTLDAQIFAKLMLRGVMDRCLFGVLEALGLYEMPCKVPCAWKWLSESAQPWPSP
jgi:hypothetical protein